MNSSQAASCAEPHGAWQIRVVRCVGLHIISTTRRRGIFTPRGNRQARDACNATAEGAQLLDVPLAALFRRSLMELLTTLKLCKDRGRRQLTFFEARHPQPEQELFITGSCE